jgi:LPXTG-site transpeptidase (sortase) family protein
MKLIGLGILLILVSAGWRSHQLMVLSFLGNSNSKNIVQSVSANLPTAIRIDSLNINLPVSETAIVKGIWEIPTIGAGHLNTSAGVGLGNMVIYAHNKNNLFGPIRWIKKDSQIEVIAQDGLTYNYQVVEVKEVSPNNVEYILPKSKEILTLYTCSGIFDSKRLVVVANRI